MWSEIEIKGYNWFRENYDEKAEFFGGSDSTISDIFSPKYNGFIEVKQLMPVARCGQFTATTAIYDECRYVMNGNWLEEYAKDFVIHHYTDKHVVGFITYCDDNFHFMGIQEFLNTYKFSWQSYGKKSGTTHLPIKYRKEIEEVIDCHHDGKMSFVDDESLIGTYFWIEDREYFISGNKACYGEIRKCAATKNITWLVEVRHSAN